MLSGIEISCNSSAAKTSSQNNDCYNYRRLRLEFHNCLLSGSYAIHIRMTNANYLCMKGLTDNVHDSFLVSEIVVKLISSFNRINTGIKKTMR